MSASINDAKSLAYQNRQAGVLILSIGPSRYSCVSCGMTRKQCDAMRKINEQICELIESEAIEIPDELSGEGIA